MTVPELETERLRMRGWSEVDLEPYATFCANEATARNIVLRGHRVGVYRHPAPHHLKP